MSKFIIIIYLCVLIHNANLKDVTYYEILGVSKQAAPQEIKQAYKNLAVKYHPDKNSDEAMQEKFLKITEAYETLMDPEKRGEYDIYGSHAAYTKKNDHQSQSKYDLFNKGLYYNDPYVVTISSTSFFNYLTDGIYFINFYLPFSEQCLRLVDHWKRFAETYQGIVEVAAVNCNYHNSFCIDIMKIGSYPSLTFFPNGVQGYFIYYEGENTFDALDVSIITYLKKKIHVPVISQLRSFENPVAYVLDPNIIEDHALTRIAYRLKDLVTVLMIDDEELREDLTDDPDITVVFQYKDIHIEISSSDERTIVKQIVQSLPVEEIDLEALKNIRCKLHKCAINPWVIYFPSKDSDSLLLHQLKIKFPNINFGIIDCQSQQELCVFLQVESTPCWGMIKRGGAYQRAHTRPETFIQNSADVYNLHTLSPSELETIMEGNMGTWMLLVVPYKVSWEHIAEPFTDASKYYLKYNFGILECTLQTEHYCSLGQGQPAVLLQDGREHHVYKGPLDAEHLTDFIQLVKDSGSVSLSERDVLSIMSWSGRSHSWLVAYLPADCGSVCRDLTHEWRIIARRLRPLEKVRVGVLQCTEPHDLCANVRAPTAKLYLVNNKQHYTLNLQQKSDAVYILEWVLDHLDKSVTKLTWDSFANQIFAQDIDPQEYNRPWLVYFQSPQCYQCFEKYPDFAFVSIFMGKAVNFGKVNCATERNLCQEEHITSQPSLRLYLRNQQEYRVVTLDLDDYNTIMDEVRLYLDSIFVSLLFSPEMLHFAHDEL